MDDIDFGCGEGPRIDLAELCRARPNERPEGGFKARVGDAEIQVLAVLQRTAVVAPLWSTDPQWRHLCRLDEIEVDPLEELRWAPQQDRGWAKRAKPDRPV